MKNYEQFSPAAQQAIENFRKNYAREFSEVKRKGDAFLTIDTWLYCKGCPIIELNEVFLYLELKKFFEYYNFTNLC